MTTFQIYTYVWERKSFVRPGLGAYRRRMADTYPHISRDQDYFEAIEELSWKISEVIGLSTVDALPHHDALLIVCDQDATRPALTIADELRARGLAVDTQLAVESREALRLRIARTSCLLVMAQGAAERARMLLDLVARQMMRSSQPKRRLTCCCPGLSAGLLVGSGQQLEMLDDCSTATILQWMERAGP